MINSRQLICIKQHNQSKDIHWLLSLHFCFTCPICQLESRYSAWKQMKGFLKFRKKITFFFWPWLFCETKPAAALSAFCYERVHPISRYFHCVGVKRLELQPCGLRCHRRVVSSFQPFSPTLIDVAITYLSTAIRSGYRRPEKNETRTCNESTTVG